MQKTSLTVSVRVKAYKWVIGNLKKCDLNHRCVAFKTLGGK